MAGTLSAVSLRENIGTKSQSELSALFKAPRRHTKLICFIFFEHFDIFAVLWFTVFLWPIFLNQALVALQEKKSTVNKKIVSAEFIVMLGLYAIYVC